MSADANVPGTVVLIHGGEPPPLPAAEGWEAIADEVLAWAVEHAREWSAPPVAHGA